MLNFASLIQNDNGNCHCELVYRTGRRSVAILLKKTAIQKYLFILYITVILSLPIGRQVKRRIS
jgi:hypothetical protein